MGSQGKHLTPATPSLSDSFLAVAMDAIRKKMQSLKSETDSLYSIINNFEEDAKESNRRSDQADCDIRDYGKKVHGLEIEFDETCDKLQKASESLEEKEKMYREVEGDVSALSRRIMLMEEEAKKSEENLAGTVTKLATTSKEADNILKKVKAVESTCMNNEVTLEELDKNLRASTKMAADNERKLGVQEDELKRAIERAELAESKLKSIEEELQLVGENMKSLETSAEKAVEREEKLKEKILSIQRKYKAAEGRFEYGEMSITKLNQKIDNIEDEIYREKLKIKKVADELGETFDDMLAHY